MRVVRIGLLTALIGALLSACGDDTGDASTPELGERGAGISEAEAGSFAGEIRLPEGSTTRLPQEPSPGTTDGVMIAGVYALVSDGVAAVVVPVEIGQVEDSFGSTIAQTTVQVEEVLLGTGVPDRITIVSGQPDFAMEVGSRYLVIVGADSTFDGSYSFVEVSTLFDDRDGRWVTRDGGLSMTSEEIASTLRRSREHLAERQEAGRAVLTVEPTGRPGEVTIAGYAQGESLGLRFCAIDDDFDPVADIRFCDGATPMTVTPDGPEITISLEQPERLQIGAAEFVSCSDARCALLVVDLDFPSTVFTIFEQP